MRKLKIVLAIKSGSDAYGEQQARAAQETCGRYGADLEIFDAGNDSIQQSKQLLNVIQSHSEHPNAVIVDPVGSTGFPQVASAAIGKGIAWVILGAQMDYVSKLRKGSATPIFSVAHDEIEIGKIQGRQLASALPDGGYVLYIQGPHASSISNLRSIGFQETRPATCLIRPLVCQWTRTSAAGCVDLWLWLSLVKDKVAGVVAQSNLIAFGARDALRKNPLQNAEAIKFMGGGPTPFAGKISSGDDPLDFTIVLPPTSGIAIETLMRASKNGTNVPEHVSVAPAMGDTDFPRSVRRSRETPQYERDLVGVMSEVTFQREL